MQSELGGARSGATGQVKALAVTGKDRSPAVPELPAAIESGLRPACRLTAANLTRDANLFLRERTEAQPRVHRTRDRFIPGQRGVAGMDLGLKVETPIQTVGIELARTPIWDMTLQIKAPGGAAKRPIGWPHVIK